MALLASDNSLLPDGHGALLLGDRSGPEVIRIAPDSQQDYAMAPAQRLVPWGGTYHMEYLLGEEGVHALALGMTDLQPDPVYWSQYMIFDPQTLALESEGPLGAATSTAEQLQLQFAVAGGGSFISGPAKSYVVNGSISGSEFPLGGLATQVIPGLWTGWAIGPTLVMGFESVVASTAFSYGEVGNAMGSRAEPEEIRIYVDFKAGWDVPLNGLTPPELQVVKETARETIEQAFQGYAVRAILGTTDAKLSRSIRRVYIDGINNGENGETLPIRLYSDVHMGTLFSSFKSAFDCGEGKDCRATAFDDMPTRSGFARGVLVTALGRGTGATVAHEFGHQDSLFAGVRSFTFHTTECHDCYDFGLPDPPPPDARYPREYFLGPLVWHPQARAVMPKRLPRKY